MNLIVGWAGEPVHKKLIENGAICKRRRRRRQGRVPTLDRGRDTALPSPLFHSGVAGIDTNRRLDRSSHEPRFGIIRGTAYNPLNLHLILAVDLHE